MVKEAIATGATVDEAREAALQQLSVGTNEEVQFEVIELPEKKVLGIFGGKSAKVRAFVELPDPQPVKKAAPQKAVQERPQRSAPEKKEPRAAHAPQEETPAPQHEIVPVTDEAKLAVVNEGVKYLSGILKLMNIEASMQVGDTESGCEIILNGDSLGPIVGRRGETLDALQYLTVLAANRGEGDYLRITLNTGNYREKREHTLRALARRMASQSIKTGRNFKLEPMNPYERRIIHTTVQDMDGVSSWSVGEEPLRRVVIGNENNPSGDYRPHNRNSRGPRRDFDRPRRSPSAAPSSNASQRQAKIEHTDAPLYGRIDK